MYIELVLKNQIHFVVGVAGGVCGVMIMMVLPAVMVLDARRKAPRNPTTNRHRSVFFNPLFAYIPIILGVVFLPYNLYL